MMGPFDWDDDFEEIRTEPEEYDSREEYELEHGPIDEDDEDHYWYDEDEDGGGVRAKKERMYPDLDFDELEDMDEDERREFLEDAGYDPDDPDFEFD